MVHLTRHELDLALLVTEDLCRLLTVPTLDWCETAASSFMRFLPKCVAVVILHVVDVDGRIVAVNAAGTAYRFAGGQRSRAEDGLPISQSPTEPLWTSALAQLKVNALLLRDRVLETSQLRSDRPQAELLSPHSVVNFESMSPRRMFEMFETNGIIAGHASVGSPDLGRGVAVYLASLDHELSVPPGVVEVLAACLPLLARKASVAFRNEWDSPKNWLNKRESSVLDHLVACQSIGQIAAEFGRSPDTIRDALKALHRKLGVTSRAQLVARATSTR